MIIFREGIIKQFTDREIALFCNTREESEKAVRALQSYGFRVNTDIYYTTTVIAYNSGIDCITSGSFPNIQYCKERINKSYAKKDILTFCQFFVKAKDRRL